MAKQILSHTWRAFRTIVSAVLLIVLLLPAGVYTALSMSGVQDRIRTAAVTGLSSLLGAPVSIGEVHIRPFSSIELHDVAIVNPSEPEDTMASVRSISTRFELYHFLRTRRIIIDYALLDGIAVHLCRANPSSPLNIQPVIDALGGDGKKKEPAHFDLRISNVAILDGSLSYDVHSEPRKTGADGKVLPVFDPSHIFIDNIELNAYVPQLANDKYSIDLAHLSLREASGFELNALKAKVSATAEGGHIENLSIKLPASSMSFEPVGLSWDGFGNIAQALDNRLITLKTTGANTLCPADFSSFAPVLGGFSEIFSIDINATGNRHGVDLQTLRLFDSTAAERMNLNLSASFTPNATPEELPCLDIRKLSLTAIPDEILRRMPDMPVSHKIRSIASATGVIHLNAGGSLDSNGRVQAEAELTSDLAGAVTLKANGAISKDFHPLTADMEATLSRLETGALSGIKDLGAVSATIDASASWRGKGKYPSTETFIEISEAIFRGAVLKDVTIEGRFDGHSEGSLTASSNNQVLQAEIKADFSTGNRQIAPAILFEGDIASFRPEAIGISVPHEESVIKGNIRANLEGRDINTMAGTIALTNLCWERNDGAPLTLSEFTLEASPHSSVPFISVTSPVINGEIKGQYSFPQLMRELCGLAGEVIPAVVPPPSTACTPINNFAYDFELHDTRKLAEFFALPVVPVYPVQINGFINSVSGIASILVDAPYLRQGDKLIQGSMLHAALDRATQRASVFVSTEMPTKKGQMQIDMQATAVNNKIDTRADWTILRTIPINGSINLSALLSRDEDNSIAATVHTNPGSITFGDDVWAIRPSSIAYSRKEIIVDGFRLDAGEQHISADGRIGAMPSDSLSLTLEGVNLLPVFETLEIDKALISGRATGTFTASQVLSDEPKANCATLRVDSIGYNRCTLGNAMIAAAWDNEKKSVFLDADIIEPEHSLHSRISGDIFPMTESLDIRFKANHVRVGFMQPFMEAFASGIAGHASGEARLFGTFKEIDMTGRILAEDLGINIDITNTRYFASDSIILTPGRIDIHDITIHDREGHTAKLSGWLKHKYFKEPVFDFRVTDAREFLCFNGTSKQNPDWYGTIYGNGNASITGYPGVVDIGVNMATTAGSTFTFVLSDRLDAEEYSFITFRDVTPETAGDSQHHASGELPEDVRKLMEQTDTSAAEESSAYNMDIHVAITPEARMTLVMDPAGGDEIRAYGEGNMRLTYQSVDNSINMWGNYTLDNGSYNFTLQDIIIKDFIIKPESTISFNGDPYAAEANLQAYYAVNANLSDLDESFLQDKELNRTNVPVHALMKVTGDIRQPDIDFDLEFPTLTQDTYRKVRSIVSTSDMMNRQIIYLLALNRFYTPDYMASTTKGSELFSVASSTISSQLSSMLGKLSENWSIAPNLRSDRGDFSDVEVDVALSSRLLNNRLLFNGNFGYRDKSLNTNQFVGDFDIEYLLNKRGSWRLKAYNRYNDQNYYLRTAQTTQGVGIMFRKDFDNIFSFLRKKETKPADEPADSAKTNN